MKSATAAKSLLVGAWRIVDMELWRADDLALLGPAHLTLERNGSGRLGSAVEFSFEGSDEGDRISGRGWAELDGDQR